MHLENDLYSIDKKLLLKAGTVITRSTLQNIAGLSEEIRYAPIKNTQLFEDMLNTFKDKRYSDILYPHEINLKIISYIRRIKMPEKIVFELAYMKKLTPYTYNHILTIAVLAAKIAIDHAQKNKYYPDMALRLSLFHDLGKSRIPLHILNKRSPITTDERHILKTHPLIGYVLLHHYFGKDCKTVAFASFQHHERLDGSGYPLGIKRLNKYSHLIGIVDTLDALISARPYRKTPFSLRAAIDLLLDESEKGRFHKGLIHTLIRYARKAKPGTKIVIAKRGRDKEPSGNSYGKTAPSHPRKTSRK
ncbi:response regulator [hydrocarbon metagenome]|uniref:Response regulator n=1 Tax=hydrocarbon metagenome TaxID=938273 RepID=A0A0W8FR76_9ZZZZ